MRDRMLAGEEFRFDRSFADDVVRCRDLLRRINDATPDQDDARDGWLRELLGAFGEGSNIRPPFRCELGFQTYVGERVFANFGLVCLDTAPVTIGDDTQLGPGVQLLTPNHPLEPVRRRERWESAEPITIGRNVWLGGAVVVCPGRHDRRRHGGRRRLRGHPRPAARRPRRRQPRPRGAPDRRVVTRRLGVISLPLCADSA